MANLIVGDDNIALGNNNQIFGSNVTISGSASNSFVVGNGVSLTQSNSVVFGPNIGSIVFPTGVTISFGTSSSTLIGDSSYIGTFATTSTHYATMSSQSILQIAPVTYDRFINANSTITGGGFERFLDIVYLLETSPGTFATISTSGMYQDNNAGINPSSSGSGFFLKSGFGIGYIAVTSGTPPDNLSIDFFETKLNGFGSSGSPTTVGSYSVPSGLDWTGWTSPGYLNPTDLWAKRLDYTSWFNLSTPTSIDTSFSITTILDATSGDGSIHSVVMEFGYNSTSISSILNLYSFNSNDMGPEPSRSSCSLIIPSGETLQYRFNRVRTNTLLSMTMSVLSISI